MRTHLLLLLPMLAIAGCAAESRTAPMSTSFNPSGPSATEPEPANSLPRGAVVQGAITNPSGNVGTTRVGPSFAPARGAY